MNLIETEFKASRKFSFKEDITSNGERLVCLTPRNVALAEAMISNDSDYSRSGNVNSGPTDKYKEYSDVIDKLRNDKISRNGFDHLLWYYHKSR